MADDPSGREEATPERHRDRKEEKTRRGSLQKKGTTYSVVLPIGPKRTWLKVGSNKQAAERVFVQAVARLHSGPYRELKQSTFAAFARKWRSEYARGTVQASTDEA